MRIDRDVAIPMDDGLVLRADVYRPDDDGRYPVLISYGPYGKGLRFRGRLSGRVASDDPSSTRTSRRARPTATKRGRSAIPRSGCPTATYASASTRAAGGARPGYIEPYATRGTKDFHDCIEWAAAQPWSSGKVGLLGISYYAITQWLVAGTAAAASRRRWCRGRA